MDIQDQLFKDSMSSSVWGNKERIDFLKINLLEIENRIENHLLKVTEDFPFLTDHSIKHSKALWRYADIIIGNQEEFLNPLEVFSLHCAFLIHDAGMCCSILDDRENIENDPIYCDYIAEYGNDENRKEEALFLTVRLRHGDNAVRIATERLCDGEYLISNVDLREELGLMIGQISKSHTCNISYIEKQFPSNYASPKFPSDWTINRQKLCYILRTADAAHIDNLRTPKTIAMIRQIKGISGQHWTFQKKLGFPELDKKDSLLTYSTNMPFYSHEQKAWWVCYDFLKVLDRELRQANEYFEISSGKNLAAKGVKSINDPLVLGQKFIRTDGWISLNTNVKAQNPASIATKLGGITLYGQPSIALRELIQNSIDAINLFRVHSNQKSDDLGKVKIELYEEKDHKYLKITDNGIGMSQPTMTNHLLDFGGSYWKSNDFRYDYEGVFSSGFKSIGKFGIGFFSVFMLGDEITVSSWRYGSQISERKTLDFFDGLNSTPILRNATESEQNDVREHGTSIKVKLKQDPYGDKEGFIHKLKTMEIEDLFSVVKYYVPSPNVRLIIKEYNNPTISQIPPNVFSSMKFAEFINYITIPKNPYISYEKQRRIWEVMETEVIELSDSNRFYGKIALLPSIGSFVLNTMYVVSKGIKITTLSNLVGYLEVDEVTSLIRNKFSSQLPFSVLKEWAIKTKKIIDEKGLLVGYKDAYSNLLISFSLEDDNTQLLYEKLNNKYEPITVMQFKYFLQKNKTFKIYQENPSRFSNPAKDCDGFIVANYNEPFSNLLKEEDKPFVKSFSDYIKEILKKYWGEYEVAQLDKLENHGLEYLENPYMQIKEYTKK